MEWFVAFCITLLIPFLGAERWRTRECAQVVVQFLTEELDCPSPVRRAAQDNPDPEIRIRCRRIVRRYEHHEVPAGLRMIHFDRSVNRKLWDEANRFPLGDDVREYIRLLLREGKTHREIDLMIEKAKEEKVHEERRWKMNQWEWRIRQWVGPRAFPP